MDDQKEEIENLRKQIKGLKISLMLTQISSVVTYGSCAGTGISTRYRKSPE